VILFIVSAWKANCPRRILQRLEAADLAAALGGRYQRIAAVEAEPRRPREVAAEGVCSEIE
jgi:hypothetical protein